MLSWKVTAGHFFVIVGYSEKAGDTSSRELIVYDPYGKWKGTTQGDYYVNTTSSSSHKGQWVYYDFTAARSDWMIVSSDAEVNNPCETPNAAFSVTSVPTTPADIVSDEEDISGFFAGVDVMASFSIYLPLVLK
jgi:hypothetical protein